MKKLAIIALFTIPFLSHAALPAFPMAFWGNATINGEDVPTGTVIRAYYGDTYAGQVVVNEAGVYGYNNPTKQKLLVSEGDGEITFKFQRSGEDETAGNSAITYPAFASGETENKPLDFTLPTPAPSGGSGGGGGGGITQPNVIIGDANNDGKVDIFDFNRLMIQWGNTGTNNTADFNNDGVVDIFDFNRLMIHWTI